MGDMGDIFNDMKAHRKEKRRERTIEQRPFIEWLQSIATSWSILPGGVRFTVNNRIGQPVTFDYWPAGGKWVKVGKNPVYAQGERRLRDSINSTIGN
jgi:hypothetical protein